MSRKLDYRIASTELIVRDLGESLASIRLSQNISQKNLAEKAGINRRTLSRLENGQGATLDTLVRVLRGLSLEDHLAALLPDSGIQPVQRLAVKKQERKRASATVKEQAKPWSWDENETP